ncbi:MAG TPA: PQQ-dependent sugar dehydrogenase [Pirellulales bacterium]
MRTTSAWHLSAGSAVSALCSSAQGWCFAMAALVLAIVATATPAMAADDVVTTPLALQPAVAFPKLQWTGWEAETDSGTLVPIRPIMVTYAPDDTNRVFVPEQRGTVYVFPNDQNAETATPFLDMSSKVAYYDKTDEEGLLGVAFHPKYRENGRFFVYYTNKETPHRNILAAYRVSKDDPNRADPASEEILLDIKKPFWNHDGGTIAFGPDGYLYIALGDGGAANDPMGNGQKLSTILGKILRIDVDHKEGNLAYAIPKDNPFVGKGDARPEIWAYGLRNVWRMAFDRKTGVLWAGDVGQDIWEEIDLIEKGGNYGWNIREGLHPFVKKGDTAPAVSEKPAGMIDPIWEYNHDIGKSITGGLVYRGKRLPELEGAYIYADYITAKIWALRYDPATKKVTANQEIPFPQKLPIMSFGEDADGDVYFTTHSLSGQGLYRFERGSAAAGAAGE